MVNFITWSVFISLELKNKLESDKNVCENNYFSDVVIHSEETNILELNQ